MVNFAKELSLSNKLKIAHLITRHNFRKAPRLNWFRTPHCIAPHIFISQTFPTLCRGDCEIEMWGFIPDMWGPKEVWRAFRKLHRAQSTKSI
jgi:hypothetical protein